MVIRGEGGDFNIAERIANHDYVIAAFSGWGGAPGWWRTECPRCLELDGKVDQKKSLGYNSETGGYNCFKCGMHGCLPLTYRTILGEIDEFALATRQPQVLVEQEVVQLADGYQPIFEEPHASNPAWAWARNYLTAPRGVLTAQGGKARGLSAETCAAAWVGAGMFGRLAGRVVVPIPDYRNPEGPWRGWVSRYALGGKVDRPYLYPKFMDRIGLLYNEPALYEDTARPVYIVEGTLDALALWPDAVAVLGKPLESQMALLVQARRPLVVCLDGDAWEQGQSLAWQLQFSGKRAGNIRLGPKVDPDEVPREWLDKEAQRVLAKTF
jgi:hypothetical protein